MDANTQAFDKWDAEQTKRAKEYEIMLAELSDAEVEDYEDIIDSHGFGDIDLAEIIGDLV